MATPHGSPTRDAAGPARSETPRTHGITMHGDRVSDDALLAQALGYARAGQSGIACIYPYSAPVCKSPPTNLIARSIARCESVWIAGTISPWVAFAEQLARRAPLQSAP
jgi:hypothetical protein